MNTKAMNELTKRAARQAERACIKELRRLQWDDATMKAASEDLCNRLREECIKVARYGLASFLEAKKSGAPDQVCEAAFCIPFISAGVKVAADADKAAVDDFWTKFTASLDAE